jgi:phage terminase large subunit-like protein
MTLTDKANKYCDNVLSGKITACRWIILACQRHKNDLKKSLKKDYPYKFDKNKAEAACQFIHLFKHTKGKWAGTQIILEPWQLFFVASIFGWVEKSTGKRRFREADLFVPRKNGKSLLAATIGLYMLAADGENGAEVYSGATTEKQAWEVFRPALQMAKANEEFLSYFNLTPMAKSVTNLEEGSRFQPLIGRPGDGASPSCAIIDEYHEHDSDQMYETMLTGMGAREQPLMLLITTAGDNLAGCCYQRQIELQAMLEGTIQDERTFALIYTVDAGDDWSEMEVLKKANPNFGVSVLETHMEAVLSAAKQSARKQSSFKTKHLNVWVGARDAYFNVDRWVNSKDPTLDIEDFKDKKCFIGLDLAAKVDIAAVELLFSLDDGDYARFGKYYLPEARIAGGDNDHYAAWARDGFITLTDGEMIDYSVIKDDILDAFREFDVQELAFDPYGATMLITELMAEGVNCVEMRQTVLTFSEPMKTLDGLIRAGKMRHNGDPVMTWMIGNCVAKEDAKANVFPRKNREQDKIDGVIALLMALGRCLVNDVNTGVIESGFVMID